MHTLLPARFINWRPQLSPNGKVDKIPFGNVTDPSDWLSYDQAQSRAVGGIGVGFVLNGDGYFAVDIDNCALSDGTGWSQQALDTLALFPGAAVEVSQSGRGLHILGLCDRSYDWSAHRNKFGGGTFEFYTTERFIAFGPYGWRGNPNTDHTRALAVWVPRRPLLDADAGSGAVSTVPDDTVLDRLLRAKSAAGVFGDAATPAQLWAADPATLARFYPSQSPAAPYDASRADAALLAHLAYWCGKDHAQMDRLFRRSGLMREKWASRPDYRTGSISDACRITTRVADWSTPSVPTGSTPSAATILSPVDQTAYFDGCVYVAATHAVWTNKYGMLDPAQFRAMYGGREFAMDTENRKFTRNAFECLTESRAVTFPRVLTTTFRPDMSTGEIVGDAVNTYVFRGCTAAPGDVAPFMDHLTRLLPDAGDRAILLLWIAAVVRRPGVMVRWAPVLQGTFGNGKTLIGKIVGRMLGDAYVSTPRPKQLNADHNGFLHQKLLLLVDEPDARERWEFMDQLKVIVSNDTIDIREMRRDGRSERNTLNVMAFTNFQGGITKDRSDRRYAIFHTAQQSVDDLVRYGMDTAYFNRLVGWIDGDGPAALRAYLDTIDISSVPGRAPDTTSTVEAIGASLSEAALVVREMIESEAQGFRGGLVSSWAARMAFEARHIRVTLRAFPKIMQELGYYRLFQAPIIMFEEGNSRPWIYGTNPNVTFARYYADNYPGRHLSSV